MTAASGTTTPEGLGRVTALGLADDVLAASTGGNARRLVP